MNDKELVSRMQHGDMQAFDELYERYMAKNRENFDRQHGRSKKEGYDITKQ